MNRFSRWFFLFFASVAGLVLLTLSIRANPSLEYKTFDRPGTRIHTLLIPANRGYRVGIAVSENLTPLKTLAEKNKAIAAINAGYFDPKNGQTTSFIIRDGRLVADPRKNDRLMKNPDLQPYLSRILNRGEWRQYRCGNKFQYSIALRNVPIPSGCDILNSVGAGPVLLPKLTAREEAFTVYEKGKLIRDSIGVNQRNARSAIGITEDGNLLWVMVEKKSAKGGFTLPELANFVKGMGAIEALNLDGGSSSSFYYQGISEYGQIDKDGAPVKRPIKSALVLLGSR